ncbi:MAG: hypothetical protein IJK46_14440 [Prevotella sp.]|nr:hypothetical protein [Prevotella sp.]
MLQNKIYIALVSLLFITFAVVLNFFPRSAWSALEKRDLARFPEFSLDSLFSGTFTTSVNSWYSDSEPFRDRFMALSMKQKDLLRIVMGDDNVTFHAAAGPVEEGEDEADTQEMDERDVGEYHNKLTADENAKIAHNGIIIVGSGSNVRALMAFGGSSRGGVQYAEAANAYKRAFGSAVNVYCMVIPTAADFYCPEKARRRSNPQQPTIRNIYSHLDPDVRAVDAYTALGNHAAEDIYLRTDHHWAPLGAFYAAEQFARVAGVPFRPLTSYERKVVHRFVGSMYGYSQDIAIKNAPEDFVYYVPMGIDYTTTYTDYTINADYQITGERKPYKGIFFYKYKDGSGGAYCTFMGGDTRITCVRTPTGNGRRVLILKDSFGNALPGYLFYSFEEVHVVDFRYFAKNMREYVRQNHITDILFANNIFNAYSSKICTKYVKYLDQPNGVYARPTATKKKTAPVSNPSPQPSQTTSSPVTQQPAPEPPTPAPTPQETPEPDAGE